MSENLKEGMLKGSTFKNILDAIDLYDINRPLGHIPKVEIAKGNIVKTAPDFVRKNGHLLMSLFRHRYIRGYKSGLRLFFAINAKRCHNCF